MFQGKEAAKFAEERAWDFEEQKDLTEGLKTLNKVLFEQIVSFGKMEIFTRAFFNRVQRYQYDLSGLKRISEAKH